MSAQTIRNALGVLQDDPDRAEAWTKLREAVGMSEDGERLELAPSVRGTEGDLLMLLEAARRSHEARRESEAVANILQIESLLAQGTPREADLVAQMARVLDEEVLDDARTVAAYERLLKLRPGDPTAEEVLETSEAKRARWADVVAKYVDEAKRVADPSFRSNLLVGASEIAYRYGRPQLAARKKSKEQIAELVDEVVSGLREALTIEPKNARAALVLERVLRTEGRWADLAALFEQRAESAAAKDDRVAGLMRLARVFQRKMDAPDRAAEVYEKVVSLQPTNREATSALVDLYTSHEKWDQLVSLYETQLATGPRESQAGIVLQIAMVNWRMRQRPDAAEPYFERLRKLEPAHPGMLNFFREWCGKRGEVQKLTQVLSDALRAMPEGPERTAIVTEVAKLSEEGQNATKAIENWRNVLRQDPNNRDAREALKRLYRQSGGWNALTDLLRGELERVPAADTAARLALLREIAGVYRDYIKSDSALVTVLTQIAQLDPGDVTVVRELARVYEALGRWRDLLTTQSRLAEVERDPHAKGELHRAIARRWLEQFSNVQNALEAYEKLAEIAPDDAEAIAKLRELYTKRRAFKPLYDLLDRLQARMPAGPERREVWLEMARIAAERLDRGADAASLYRKLVDEDPSATHALDALEKQAERDKDYKTVAEVLERRVKGATDDATKLAVLQKLGAVYTDRLHDVEGAKGAWRRVLELQPGHSKAVRVLRDAYLAQGDYEGLTELYVSQGDFEGLAEVLSSAADRATDPTLKVDLSYRAADVYTKRLKAPERAFRAYERVLSVRPDDARAAMALVPLYEKEEKWARLPPLYEVLLGRAGSDATKLRILEKLTQVTGQQLGDRAAAFAYARRAFDLAAADDAAHAVQRLEAAAHAAEAWGEMVDALARRAEKAPPAERRMLRAKIAEIQAREGQIDDAVRGYRALVEEDDKDEAAVAALDKLLRGEDRHDDLRWLFEKRLERASDAGRKLELLAEWAQLEEDAFQAPERAVALYRRILQIEPEHAATLRSLARLLRAAGDLEGAIEVLSIDRTSRSGEDRASREVDIAQLQWKLGKHAQALASAREALAAVRNHAAAIGVVEDLLGVPETRAAAAVVLDEQYGEIGQLVRQAEVLEVRIATAAAKDDRIELYGRLATVQEKLGAIGTAFDVVARAAREFPTELPLWDRLAVLAQRTKRSAQFVRAIAEAVPPTGDTGLPASIESDLAERAATLYEEMLGDADGAQPYWERILAREPTNERAFARLKQTFTTREKWGELEDMYERVIAAAPDDRRKSELLDEIALIAEEITGEKAKATRYYERILELEAGHDHAMRSLDALYAAQERWAELASLLERRVAHGDPQDALGFKLRLGTLWFTRLGDPKRALDELEQVLEADDGSREARDLVEKCLDVAALRPRAAVVLERVYHARDEVPDLVRVLEIRLESDMDASERRELLRRVAELRDERLHDEPGAFDAFARLAPLAPSDDAARERLLTLAKRTGAHERAAEVLLKAADAAESPQPRAEILTSVAVVFEEDLRDADRAEAIYLRVLSIDPEDPGLALPAARSLERIYTIAERHADLARMLETQVSLEDNADTKHGLLARLGALYEDLLSDPKTAIGAWTRRLADDPADERTLQALDRLYERTSAWRELVDTLRARERGAQDAGARRDFMVRAAQTLADKLNDVPEAILAYRAVLDDFGADKATLGALERLYASAEKWSDLAETIEAHLALADADQEKLDLLAHLGEVRHKRTGELGAALEAYARALAIEGTHAPSRAALEELTREDAVRREAAGILRPLYERDGAEPEALRRLLRVLEIEAEYAERDAKLAVLAQAVKVAEEPLRDPHRAWGYAARGLHDAAATPAFGEWHQHAERLTEQTGDWGALVALLREAIPEIADGDVQLAITLRVADLAREKLANADLAREYYVKALEMRADERRALVALEALYEEAKDWAALLDILIRRVEHAVDDAEKKALLFKQARLDDETLRDHPAAIEVYETILGMGLDDAAIAALERLYTDASRWADLVALHEREIGETQSSARKADLHYALGRVHETRLMSAEDAFAQYDAALGVDAQHAKTVEALEALMLVRAHAARAAEMLEGVYLARLDWRRVMATLEARLDVSEDPDERRLLLRRLAKLHEEQGDDFRAALETNARLLAEDVTDEQTWGELERLARVANTEGRLAEIFATELEKVETDEPATARLAKRTGELWEAQKDVEKALRFYRRAHDFAPDEPNGTFEAIDRLLREANRPADRVAHYRRALKWKLEAKDCLETLHTIAAIEENDLASDDLAIDTHKQALEADDADVHSLEALTRLYARRERWRELADLVRKRAEQSALPDDEARFRLDLGRLLEHKLGETPDAITEYHAVTDLAPPPAETGKQGVSALEAILARGEHRARLVEILRPLYERADDWRKLVELNDVRLAIADTAAERVAIFRETAKLREERGADPLRAFQALREAFVLDPDDGETRGEMDRLAAVTKRWDDLAESYEQGIAKSEDLGKKELLAALARVHDKRRDDPRRALDAWGRLFVLDETDIGPLEEMDALATILSDWPALVRVLSKKAELLPSDEDRASTWRRVGEAKRDMLDDLGGAIEAYERALELEPESAWTLDNLIPLYEQKDDAARLVDLYRRRVDLCTEDENGLKFQLLVDAATRYEAGLEDRREAIAHLNEALAVPEAPAVLDVLKRLDSLYTHEQMWPELLENLRAQIDRATGGSGGADRGPSGVSDEGTTRYLKKRVGALLAGQLEEPKAALEPYREVLAGEYDADAAAAIRRIGEDYEDLRLDAAAVLEPVLRRDERWADLTSALEMRLRAQTEPADRATTLRAIAETYETRLDDPSNALDAIVRALVEEPHDGGLHESAERLAPRLPGDEGWRRYAEALQDRAASLFDARVTTDLYQRLGRVAEEHLKDDARAARAYASAAEQAGDSEPVLVALDRLYGRLNDPRSLAEVLERRIALEADPKTQAELLHRLASLQIHEFADRSRGLATLRQALERAPDHAASRDAVTELLGEDALFDEAFDALEWTYRQLGEAEHLATLYGRRVTRAIGPRDRAHARLDLARVLEEQVKDAARAQRVVEEALGEDPADLDVLAEIERLAPRNEGGWKSASDAFERALGDAKDVPAGTRGELWIRLATWRRDRMNDARTAEDAFVHALAVDAENLDVIRAIEGLRRAPGRERDLVATLRQRAHLETEIETKRELLREAKALAETPIADAALAEEVLRDLLVEDEGDTWTLTELVKLREAAGDWKEVASLLLRRAELENPPEQHATQHRAAEVIVEHLRDPDRAITIYEAILEAEPSDRLASDRVRELYVREGRFKDVAKLLELLVETAQSAGERAQHRIDLAKLQEEKFGAPRDAAETLRAILDEEASHEGAVAALSALLEKTSQYDELAELLSQQIDRAVERSDAATELTLRVRLGELYESRLEDTPRALAAYEAVLEREPTHKLALEAVARLAETRGAWDRASSALAKLVELANGAGGVPEAVRLATVREHMGDLEGVEAALKSALAFDEGNPDVRARLRSLYEREKRWEPLATLLVSDSEWIAKTNPDAEPAPRMPSTPPVYVPAPMSGRGSTLPQLATLPPPPNTGPIAEQVRLLRRAAEIHMRERGAPSDAVPILERATELTPTDRELLLLLCDAYSAAARRGARPREGHRVVRQQADEGALALPPPARARARVARRQGRRARAARHGVQDRSGERQRAQGPRRPRARDERPGPRAEDVPRAPPPAARSEPGDLQGRGVLLPRRDLREAG